MAVYTKIDERDLDLLLADYDIGGLKSFAGIEQGVENTNYALDTSKGRFVLTLFEKRVDEKDLPFFTAAMVHLSKRGVPAPQPVADRSGALFHRVRDRPAAIVTFLDGAQRMSPSVDDCRRAGALNARMRVAAAGFPLQRKNALGLGGWKGLAMHLAKDADRCATGLSALIDDEMRLLEATWPRNLPAGLIHADLYPDNVFFAGDQMSGVIDFYFACTDFFAYDLALTLKGWASVRGRLDLERAAAFIDGYESLHRLSDEERRAAPILLRGAAMRILLTRLNDWLNQVDGAVVAVKDPLEYRDLLLFHRDGGSLALFGAAR